MLNNILISKETREVISKDEVFIGMEGENLQEVLIFNLDEQIEGNAIIEILFPDESTAYIEIEKTERGYELPVKSSLLTQNGIVKMQLRIIQAGQEIFKSDLIRFKVKESINATTTIPEEYPTWIDNLEALKLNLENAEKQRVEAEKSRVDAEKARVESFNQMGQDVDNAIGSIVDLQKAYDKNAADKIKEFNDNAGNKLKEHNTNATNKITEFNENVVKQTENIDKHVEDKITEYDEHTQDITNRLDNIEEKDTNQDKLIKDLQNQIFELETENENIKNQIPVGEEEGENITINDSSDMEFKELRIGGNSWQETRSGKNFFDKASTKITSNNAGETQIDTGKRITLTGTTYSYSVFRINQNISKYAGKTVRLNAIFSKSNSNLNPKYGVILGDSNYSTGRELKGESNKSGYTITFDLPSTFENGREYLFIRLYGTEDKEGYVGDYVDFTNVILTIDNEDISYEPYGAMPSPEFRSEIRNVGDNGSANITVCNKNLLKTLKWINGTYIHAKLPKLNTSYFLSLRLKDGKTIPSDLYFGFSRDGDYNSAGFTKWLIDKGEFSSYNSIDRNNFKYTSNIRYDGTVLGYIAVFPATYAGNLGEYFDIQLEEKINYDHATDYVESESQQFTFPLSEGQRMYKDSYLADNGVHHKRWKDVFTGNEVVQSYHQDTSNGFCGFAITPTHKHPKNSKASTNVLCSFLEDKNSNNVYFNTGPGIWAPDLGYTLYLAVPISILADITDKTTQIASFKSWLAEQYANGTPFEVEYDLAEEIIEPYTEEQQLVYNEIKKAHSYKNVTHIFSTDEIKPINKVIYRKDLETHINNEIDKKTNALTNAIIELGGTVNV